MGLNATQSRLAATTADLCRLRTAAFGTQPSARKAITRSKSPQSQCSDPKRCTQQLGLGIVAIARLKGFEKSAERKRIIGPGPVETADARLHDDSAAADGSSDRRVERPTGRPFNAVGPTQRLPEPAQAAEGAVAEEGRNEYGGAPGGGGEGHQRKGVTAVCRISVAPAAGVEVDPGRARPQQPGDVSLAEAPGKSPHPARRVGARAGDGRVNRDNCWSHCGRRGVKHHARQRRSDGSRVGEGHLSWRDAARRSGRRGIGRALLRSAPIGCSITRRRRLPMTAHFPRPTARGTTHRKARQRQPRQRQPGQRSRTGGGQQHRVGAFHRPPMPRDITPRSIAPRRRTFGNGARLQFDRADRLVRRRKGVAGA